MGVFKNSTEGNLNLFPEIFFLLLNGRSSCIGLLSVCSLWIISFFILLLVNEFFSFLEIKFKIIATDIPNDIGLIKTDYYWGREELWL